LTFVYKYAIIHKHSEKSDSEVFLMDSRWLIALVVAGLLLAVVVIRANMDNTALYSFQKDGVRPKNHVMWRLEHAPSPYLRLARADRQQVYAVMLALNAPPPQQRGRLDVINPGPGQPPPPWYMPMPDGSRYGPPPVGKPDTNGS